MDITEIRPSFTVLVADSQEPRGYDLATTVSDFGYDVSQLGPEDKFENIIRDKPPHIMVCHWLDSRYGDAQWIQKVLQILPELKIIFLCSSAEAAEAAELYGQGVYDIVYYPFEAGEITFIKALDRATENLYFLYTNEQLIEEVAAVEGGATPPAAGDGTATADAHSSAMVERADEESQLVLLDLWHEQVTGTNEFTEAVQYFLTALSRWRQGRPVLFIKYLPSYHSLAIAQAAGGDIKSWRGLGLELGDEKHAVSLGDLNEPMRLKGLEELIRKGLNSEKYFAFPLHVHEELKGIFAVLDDPEDFTSEPNFKLLLRSLKQKLSLLQLEKRIHNLITTDDETHVLNRSTFLIRLSEEFSRARRISSPVALVLISVDDYADFKNAGQRDAAYLMRMIATIIRRNGRVNDSIGRLSPDELALILPHTTQKGAALKAERVRRIVESADFRKVLSVKRGVTVSVGVSEYPSHGHDTSEILLRADKALLEVRKVGKNKVCLAQAPRGFVPDFVIPSID